MTDVIANLFIDVHPSNANLTSFIDGNCILIASTVSVYSLWQMLGRVLADESTSVLRIALYDHSTSRFEIAFHGMQTNTHPNIR
jgi:hypothetical protein